jgi:hypothetical protein
MSAVAYANNKTINPDVVAISMSWGYPEMSSNVPNYSTEENYDSYFVSNTTVFFAASGDTGYTDQIGNYPAVSPNVIAVGGTNLTFNANGLVTETGWNDSGGDYSRWEPEPLWQQAYGVPAYGYRADPDVSFFAAMPGVPIYTSYDPSNVGWTTFYGTSLAAPCWAAIQSLGLSCNIATLYKIRGMSDKSSALYPSDFRDITNGNNGQSAGPGWDYVTGLGSPLTTAFNYLSLLQASDINRDGIVDIFDAILMANSFGAQAGDEQWYNTHATFADLNNDYKVDIYDAIIFASYFGQESGMSDQSLPAGTMTEGGPAVLVDPSQTTAFTGEAFTVNVDVTNVTDLQGWEFQLYWNSTVLNCTNVAIQTPSEWQNNTLNFGPGLQENYNATTAMYWQAQAATYPASSFNGSMTIVTLTFQALQPGTTALTLADVKLGDSTAEPIACTVSSGSVSVYYGRYMRGDTETVNGLGAYVLSIPESSSSAYATESASGSGASWGIRAFVRHSNGSEQEISLNGQTGTPQAVVSMSSGAGLLSATVSVAQTALQPTDSLVIRVYMKVGSSGWTLCATFTTEQLQASTLQAATWTVYYYVGANWNRITQKESAGFYWGATYDSRIQNLQYT